MELQQFFNLVEEELRDVNTDRFQAFRLATLASKGKYIGLRSVILRHVGEELELLVYTDTRSSKVKKLSKKAKATLLFYNPKLKLQVVIEAHTKVLQSGDLYEQHKKLALESPNDYASVLPPGSKIDIKEYETTTEAHFSLLHFSPVSIQALQLEDPQHKRAKWMKKDDWAGTWLVP